MLMETLYVYSETQRYQPCTDCLILHPMNYLTNQKQQISKQKNLAYFQLIVYAYVCLIFTNQILFSPQLIRTRNVSQYHVLKGLKSNLFIEMVRHTFNLDY